MKIGIWFFMMLVSAVEIHAKSPCAPDFISSEKNLKKVYEQMQKNKSQCRLQPEHYLEFSKRAYLAGQYNMVIWSCKSGIIDVEQNKDTNLELSYFLAISYLEKERFEDAIDNLKKIVFDKNWQETKNTLMQKAHMALIETYHRQHKEKDENVKYLIRLFKSRYSSNDYLYTVRTWNANN